MSAKENEVVPLNYSTRFREWWSEQRPRFAIDHEWSYPNDLADRLLARAQHFLLPPWGQTLHNRGRLEGKYAPLLHLPYPITAFEFHSPLRTDVPNPSSKHIALCVDSATSKAMRIAHLAEDEWMCISVFYLDIDRLWIVYPAVNVISRSRVREVSAHEREMTMAAVDEIHEEVGIPNAVAPKVGDVLLDIKVLAMPNTSRALSPVSAFADTRDELVAAVEACASLGCRNVGTHYIEVRAQLNRKRQSKCKLPLVSYHVLDLKADEGPRVIERRIGTGTHASPRQHLRRGHIRWLSAKESVWVRATLVKGTTPGTVKKDYRFTDPPDTH